MDKALLEATAAALVAPGKGILAAEPDQRVRDAACALSPAVQYVGKNVHGVHEL